MPKFILDTFQNMNLSVRPRGQKFSHYLLQGVDPLYDLANSAVQETQFAPLAASYKWNSVRTGLDGNLTTLMPSFDSNYSVFGLTDKQHVYAFDSFYDMGIPASGFGTGPSSTFAIFNGNLVLAYTLATFAMRVNLPVNAWQASTAYTLGQTIGPTTPNGFVYSCTTAGTSGATQPIFPTTLGNTVTDGTVIWTCGWTQFGLGQLQTAAGLHYMEPFLDFLAVSNGDSAFGYSHLIQKITSSWTFTTGIDLGVGWGCIGMKNYTDKYLAIAAGYKGGLNYGTNQLFLWNGIADRYNHNIPIPGKYIDMTVMEGRLYVAVSVAAGSTAVYRLEGLRLKLQFYSQFSNITKLFNAGNRLGVLTGNGLLVYYIVGRDEISYYYSGDVWTVGAAGGPNNQVYVGNTTSLSNYPLVGAQSGFNNILYNSEYLEPQSGLTAQLDKIEVYYDTPPATAGDYIQINLLAVDENAPTATLGNKSVSLDQITPSTAQTPKMHVLDGKGLTFNKLRIQAATQTAPTTTWNRPIIRKIIVYYTETGYDASKN